MTKLNRVILFLLCLCFSSCTPPPVSVAVTTWEYSESLPKFASMIRPPSTLYTIDSLNRRLTREDVCEVGVQLRNEGYFYSQRTIATNDSVYLQNDEESRVVAIDSIRFVEIFDENAATGKLWRSAIIGGFACSIMSLGYIPPNPPEPNATSFGVAAGVGTAIGLLIAGRNSERIIIVKKRDIESLGVSDLIKKYIAAS